MLPSDVKRLILDFHHRAEALAGGANDSDLLIAFMLHQSNVERLLCLEYVTMGRTGEIKTFLERPSLRVKADAVISRLKSEGFCSEAVSVERFSVLMPTAGVVKHALFPQIGGLEQQVEWARQASSDLYRHYFREPLVSKFERAA